MNTKKQPETVDEARDMIERYSQAIGKDPAEITGTGLADVFGFEHTLLLRGLEVLQNE